MTLDNERYAFSHDFLVYQIVQNDLLFKFSCFYKKL